MQTCKLDSLNLSCKQNCLKSQKYNFEIRKELQLKVYLNYNIPSLQIVFIIIIRAMMQMVNTKPAVASVHGYRLW